jgi:hypothetical protein
MVRPSHNLNMKNRKLPKTDGSKNGLRKPQAGSSSSMEKRDPCCMFLKAWLARRPNRSDDDLAAAFLIYLLWASRGSSKIDGLCGFAFHPGTLECVGIAVPDEALRGLEVLSKAGLVAYCLSEGEPISPPGTRRFRSPRRTMAMIVDLLWLAAHQKP